jgi:hypothetical protein
MGDAGSIRGIGLLSIVGSGVLSMAQPFSFLAGVLKKQRALVMLPFFCGLF